MLSAPPLTPGATTAPATPSKGDTGLVPQIIGESGQELFQPHVSGTILKGHMAMAKDKPEAEEPPTPTVPSPGEEDDKDK